MISAGVTYRAGLGQDSPPRADGRQTRMILCERTAISNVLRSDASDKTAKQSESDDHFRLADNPQVFSLAHVVLIGQIMSGVPKWT